MKTCEDCGVQNKNVKVYLDLDKILESDEQVLSATVINIALCPYCLDARINE